MVLANVWTKHVPISRLCVAVIGCGPAEPEFGFGEKDMQDAILGDWQGTMTLEGRAATTFIMELPGGSIQPERYFLSRTKCGPFDPRLNQYSTVEYPALWNPQLL